MNTGIKKYKKIIVFAAVMMILIVIVVLRLVRILNVDESEAIINFAKGETYLTNGEYDAAKSEFYKSILEEPQSEAEYLELAKIYVSTGDVDELERLMDYIWDSGLISENIDDLMQLYSDNGDRSKAKNMLNELIGKYDKDIYYDMLEGIHFSDDSFITAAGSEIYKIVDGKVIIAKSQPEEESVYDVGEEISDIISVTATSKDIFYINSEGEVLAQGDNLFSQMGLPAMLGSNLGAEKINGLDNIVQVSPSLFDTFALDIDGNVYMCGNFDEKLQDEDNVDRSLDEFRKIEGLSDVIKIENHIKYVLFYTRYNKVYALGKLPNGISYSLITQIYEDVNNLSSSSKKIYILKDNCIFENDKKINTRDVEIKTMAATDYGLFVLEFDGELGYYGIERPQGIKIPTKAVGLTSDYGNIFIELEDNSIIRIDKGYNANMCEIVE